MVPRAVGIVAALAVLQGCSSSSDPQLAEPGGAPRQEQSAQHGQQQPWRQPSKFDADGPPSGTYRGGRDPVTGKAAEWSPNGPVETSTVTPLPSRGRPQPVARNSPPQLGPSPQPASSGIGISGMVKVRQGDTLESIAHAHGITVPALMQANKMTSRSGIKAGQQLVIPQ